MDNVITLHERVEVVTVYRVAINASPNCYPAKMKYQGQVIEFTELGLRHPTSKGTRMIHVFDMSDGVNDYRLEFDAEGLTWTLMAIREGHDARD